jgi:hypothetical protein
VTTELEGSKDHGIREWVVPLQTSLKFWLMTNLTHSFSMYLFHASTCFEQQVLIIRRVNLYYTSSGITHSESKIALLLPECVIPDDVLIQVGPPDDEHLLLETCRDRK